MCVVEDRTKRLRNYYNLLASTLRIRGEARVMRVPSHLRTIKIKELREMQKRGVTQQKQLADVLGTRLLASASRPALKRYQPSLSHVSIVAGPDCRKPSEDEASDSDSHTGTPFYRHANGSETCVF